MWLPGMRDDWAVWIDVGDLELSFQRGPIEWFTISASGAQ